MASISEVFNEEYPELSKQLDELGVKDTETLVDRFKSNGKYLNEVLDYDLKDNEKIRSIAENNLSRKEESQKVIINKKDEETDWKGMIIAFIIFVLFSFYMDNLLDFRST